MHKQIWGYTHLSWDIKKICRSPLAEQGLKIQCCHCSVLGCHCGVGSIPGLETPTCCGQGQKQNKTNRKCASLLDACAPLHGLDPPSLPRKSEVKSYDLLWNFPQPQVLLIYHLLSYGLKKKSQNTTYLF